MLAPPPPNKLMGGALVPAPPKRPPPPPEFLSEATALPPPNRLELPAEATVAPPNNGLLGAPPKGLVVFGFPPKILPLLPCSPEEAGYANMFALVVSLAGSFSSSFSFFLNLPAISIEGSAGFVVFSVGFFSLLLAENKLLVGILSLLKRPEGGRDEVESFLKTALEAPSNKPPPCA